MKTAEEFKAFLNDNSFLVIGHGEGYDTKICSGQQLTATVLSMIFDPAPEHGSEDYVSWRSYLLDKEQWSYNEHGNPYWWKSTVGEIGAIDIILITKEALDEARKSL